MNIIYIIAIILITIAVLFMLYICGYFVIECMNHPIKCCFTQDTPIHPACLVVVDTENVIISDINQ